MKNFYRLIFFPFLTISACLILFSCQSKGKTYQEGTYGYDLDFFKKHDIEFLELTSSDNLSRIIIVPAYQGRVMTSTSHGSEGLSYGWINYSFIESGEADPQFNPFGGEDRFWLGPEGGPYSLYFEKGVPQVFENWVVPSVIDTDSFDTVIAEADFARFTKSAAIVNASGTVFDLGIERTISLLSKEDLSDLLGVDIPLGIDFVAYESDNVITNKGDHPWTKEEGLLSVWILGMFNPSPETTVFIPFKPDGEGVIVNDDYFGKVPGDRLLVEDDMIYFRADGKYRSKIGIPPGRARELSGSYDPIRNVLTVIWCSLPEEPRLYVNSAWGDQDDPYDGDVINSYNDGPLDDGSIMGPFYELETSSPAIALSPDESAGHIQRVMHFEGDEEKISVIVNALFDVDIEDIKSRF